MKVFGVRLLVVACLLAMPTLLRAQSVTFEAESGTLGTDWAISNSTSPIYITITSNGSGSNPGSSNRVATYSVTFPAGGTYQLYARVRVGPNTFNDDSLFFASSFGFKSPTNNADWILVNGLANAGFTNTTDVVTGGGSLGSGMWKWINLSQFTNQAGFVVNAGNLTQMFQIGAREDGLDMDKFVFGTAGTAFTVSNLDTGTAPPSITLTNTFTGPDGAALHRFNPLNNGRNLDGANPVTGLVLAGNVLCGTTLNGGLQGAGTAFYVSLDGTNFNAFRSFTNAPDAGNPEGDLAVSGNGIFGTSFGGGTNGTGAIFIGQTNGTVIVLRAMPACSADNATNSGGASPTGPLALAGGTVLGTMSAGGAAANGAIFSMSTNGSAFTVLHDFSLLDCNTGTNTDGAVPGSGLILSGGTLYGTASGGGFGGAGVVFSVRTDGNSFTVLHHFSALDMAAATNVDGAIPFGGLVLSGSTLFGTTSAGGQNGAGTIFSMQTNGTGFAVLHHFSATDPLTGTNVDGAAPVAGLTLAAGMLYGTASAGGGAGANGTVYSMKTDGSQFTIIHSFGPINSPNGTNADGAMPAADVLVLGNSLYGTTSSGGPGAVGTIFSLAIPPSPAMITNTVRNLDGSVTLFFQGGPSSTNIVQVTTDLTPPAVWQNVSTNVADTNGAWQFTDTNTASSVRFYRSYAR